MCIVLLDDVTTIPRIFYVTFINLTRLTFIYVNLKLINLYDNFAFIHTYIIVQFDGLKFLSIHYSTM